MQQDYECAVRKYSFSQFINLYQNSREPSLFYVWKGPNKGVLKFFRKLRKSFRSSIQSPIFYIIFNIIYCYKVVLCIHPKLIKYSALYFTFQSKLYTLPEIASMFINCVSQNRDLLKAFRSLWLHHIFCFNSFHFLCSVIFFLLRNVQNCEYISVGFDNCGCCFAANCQ